MSAPARPAPAGSRESATRTYRALWRWHFYAGLVVAPFLLILSITGAIYLFNDEIDDALYPARRFVPAHVASLPPSRLVDAALSAHPGKVTRIDMPAAANRPAIVFVTPVAGDPLRVAVDPGSGRVLGDYIYTRTLVGMADTLHGSLMLGWWGGLVMELAAGWAIVLIATGLYLWWPRGRRGLAGVVFPRLHLRGRVVWRDIHAVTGVWTVALIAFLLLTGLPWAQVQGDVIRDMLSRVGGGYPVSHATSNAPSSAPMKAALGSAPWTLEGAPMPVSAMPSAHAEHMAPAGTTDRAAIAGLDAVVATLARDHALAGGYRLFPPAGPTGVYTAYTYPDRPQGQRSLYFDRYSGRLIRDVGFADYGIGARAIELGVQLHMGNYFGTVNQIVMLLPCIGIVVLVVSGVAMWWKRRPAGRLAAPPRIPGARIAGAVAILTAAGVMMPVLGVSLLAAAAIDLTVRWRSARATPI
ncbi:peptidase M4 [Sphingomonas ginsenosidimutans]|uniref:Peptidase M4 n=1 Tax=Sphingomonas ginsenosidimutans TaxID=862134 RepID=A0A2A4I3G8_9SPHN|nr:PepSY domain-containing protein [Sphingomonas ginsenosidimutans]PCG10831.1 peptidase M4 [Sphingomonas ginsenosidimutans]